MPEEDGPRERRDFIPVSAELYQVLERWSAMRVGRRLVPYPPRCAWKAAREAGVRTTIYPHLFRSALGLGVTKDENQGHRPVSLKEPE